VKNPRLVRRTSGWRTSGRFDIPNMGLQDFADREPSSPLRVKNTFLEFQEELSLEDCFSRRQVSEPSPCTRREHCEDEGRSFPLQHEQIEERFEEGYLTDQSTHVSSEERQLSEEPKEQSPDLPGWEEVYTVMMRNLPNKYSQHLLVQEIAEVGFGEAYDFLYLPMDNQTGANRGYAFINFVSSSLAQRFKLTYEGKSMKSFNSTKIVNVTPAALQGFEANLQHYSSTKVNRGSPGSRPIFLRNDENAAKLSLPPKKERTRHPRRRRQADAKDWNGQAQQGYGGAAEPMQFAEFGAQSVIMTTSPMCPQGLTGTSPYCVPGFQLAAGQLDARVFKEGGIYTMPDTGSR